MGGPGKKAQYNPKVIPASRNSTEIPCECLNKKGHPVKKCKRCQSSVPNPPLPSPSPSPPPGTNFLKDNVMTMQYCSVKYTPSTSNDNWTQLCQIAAQARSVACGAGQPNSNGDEIPNFDLPLKLWQGQIAVPNIGTLYNNWAAAATFTSATPAHKPPAPPKRLGGGHLREPHAPHEVPGEGVPQVHLRGGGLRQDPYPPSPSSPPLPSAAMALSLGPRPPPTSPPIPSPGDSSKKSLVVGVFVFCLRFGYLILPLMYTCFDTSARVPCPGGRGGGRRAAGPRPEPLMLRGPSLAPF